MKENNIEEIDTLEDTIIFNMDNSNIQTPSETVNEIDRTGEVNVIREKNEVVDFTSPVEIVSEDKVKKEKPKKAKGKKEKPKMKFKLFSNIKKWFIDLPLKKRIIVLAAIFLVLVGIIVSLILLVKDDKKKKENVPDVILEADNYRYENGTLIFLGEENKELGKYKCKNKDEKKCYVAYQSSEDDFTEDKYLNEAGEKIDVRSKIINDNYVFIVDNKKGSNDDIILYSNKSKSIVDEYKSVKQSNINKTYVILKDKTDKYGVLDLTEENPKTLINFVYNYAGSISSEAASKYIVVSKNDKYYLSNYEEKLLSSGFTNNIVEYNDNFIVTKDKEGKYEIFDFDGNQINSNKFIFIKLSGNFYAGLLDNGLFVYDKENLKYNELPIALSSTSYNRTYVFDANNQMIKNEVAFEIASTDEYITVTRGKAIDSLSIKEAQANKDHPFVSYFSGILYIYADEAKTNLLGKYTCKSKNTSGQFDHCAIASSSALSNNDLTYNLDKGIISIVNNRYAFIKDTLSTGNIYLYDLQQSKKMGPYSDVEVYEMTSDKESIKNINGAYVIAKNSKNQYGLLKINNQSVDIILNFEYTEIERIKDYFLVKKSNNTYSIYNNSGSAITKDIQGKIYSYTDNYVTVKNGNNYSIYNYSGEKQNNKDFAYIKLESNYFVGIKDNNLGVYKYDKDSNNILLSPVKIKNAESWKEQDYFRVTAVGSGYNVKVQDGENNKEYNFDLNGNLV